MKTETIISPIKDTFPWIFKTGEETSEEYKDGVEKGGEGTDEKGENIVQKFISGLNKTFGLETAIQDIEDEVSKLDIGEKAKTWGANLIDNFRCFFDDNA